MKTKKKSTSPVYYIEEGEIKVGFVKEQLFDLNTSTTKYLINGKIRGAVYERRCDADRKLKEGGQN